MFEKLPASKPKRLGLTWLVAGALVALVLILLAFSIHPWH